MFWPTFLTVFIILLMVSSVVVIVFDDTTPAAKLAWILAIVLLPVLGVVLYLFFGINNRYHYVFRRRHRRYMALLKAETSPELRSLLGGHTKDDLIREEFRPLARLLGTGFHPCVSDGNAFEIITEGKRKYELLLEDLRNARESIHIEYFRFGTDSGSEDVRNILIQKAKEGVKVRFINEAIEKLRSVMIRVRTLQSIHVIHKKGFGAIVREEANVARQLKGWARKTMNAA